MSVLIYSSLENPYFSIFSYMHFIILQNVKKKNYQEKIIIKHTFLIISNSL